MIIPPARHLALHRANRSEFTGQYHRVHPVMARRQRSCIGPRLGRPPLFMRYGKLVLVTPEKNRRCRTPAGREPLRLDGGFSFAMLARVRHLIGIPCRHLAMNYKLFSCSRFSLGNLGRRAVICGHQNGQDEQLIEGPTASHHHLRGGCHARAGGL